jgi:hypothetical protein
MSYGTVTGQFVTSVIDSADAGRDPDMVPCSGTISFHPNSTRVINTGAIPNPLTIFNKDITTSLDASGYIVGPDGVRGIKLVASDDPDTSPTMFSYTVTIALNGVSPLSFSFMLPGGTSIDLTTVAPVPADIAGEVSAWVAAVEQTRLNVVAAQAAQAAAEAAKNAAISAGVPTPTTAGQVLTALTSSTYGWANAAAATSDPLKANLASPTFTGTVGGITKSMVGLASANNTSDAGKPVSTATQAALDAKAALAAGVPTPTTTGTVLTAISPTTFGWSAPTGGSGTSDPLKANVTEATRRYSFEPGNSAGTRRWMRLLTVNGLDASSGGHANFILSGTGDFGTPQRGTMIVHTTQRGDNLFTIKVWSWNVDNTQDRIEFYSKQISAFVFEVWIYVADYNLTHDLHMLTSANTTVNLDSQTTIAPTATTAWPFSDIDTLMALKAPLASPVFTGNVSGLTKMMVGLGDASNTADADKPVSTATASALGLKAPLASPTFTGTVSGVTAAMVGLGSVNNTTDAAKPVSTATQTALDGKANVGSTSSSTNSVKTPTVWAAGVVYAIGDYFSTTAGVIYRVIVAHTAAATEPTAATANFTVWGSSGNFPGSVIVRNALGEVAFSAAYASDVPTAASELTNKQYVDTQVATVAAPAIPFVFYPIVWNGTSWTYGNVAITARPSGMRSGDIAFFDGVGTLPTWATTNDLMTEG